MSLLQLRQNIAESLVANIEELRAGYTHGGAFNLPELLRTAVTAPCVVCACLGINNTAYQGGVTVANAQWGVFVVCRGSSQVQRDSQALALVELVLARVYANDWKADAVSGPRDVTATNLFSENVDKTGTALWVISWDQGVDLLRDVEGLTPFLGVDAAWNLTESTNHPDATDTIQLQGDLS